MTKRDAAVLCKFRQCLKNSLFTAGWELPENRRASTHNPKVLGSNPSPATKVKARNHLVPGFSAIYPLPSDKSRNAALLEDCLHDYFKDIVTETMVSSSERQVCRMNESQMGNIGLRRRVDGCEAILELQMRGMYWKRCQINVAEMRWHRFLEGIQVEYVGVHYY